MGHWTNAAHFPHYCRYRSNRSRYESSSKRLFGETTSGTTFCAVRERRVTKTLLLSSDKNTNVSKGVIQLRAHLQVRGRVPPNSNAHPSQDLVSSGRRDYTTASIVHFRSDQIQSLNQPFKVNDVGDLLPFLRSRKSSDVRGPSRLCAASLTPLRNR